MARRPPRKRDLDPELPILQLKVRLLDVSPMVWRRLLIYALTDDGIENLKDLIHTLRTGA